MPRIKFSSKKLDSIKKTESGQIEYSDSEDLKGVDGYLCLLVGKRKKAFAVRYRLDGKRKRIALDATYPATKLKDARTLAVRKLLEVLDGGDPAADKVKDRNAWTFSDLWDDYITSKRFTRKAEKSKYEEKRKYSKYLKSPLGNLKAKDINRRDIAKILKPMATHAPVQSNRTFCLLSIVFKHALNHEDEIIDTHPMFGLEKWGGQEDPKNRFLKDDEIKTIWPHLTGSNGDIFKLILLTCQRPGEIYAMRWNEIDFEDNIWTIPKDKTKSKKNDHLVPLSPQVLCILNERKDNDSDYVFPATKGNSGHITTTNKFRYRLHKSTKVTDWTAHDLRRTGRTLLSKINIRTSIAERILGHSQGRIKDTYDRYSHLPQKRAALIRLGRKIDLINDIK